MCMEKRKASVTDSVNVLVFPVVFDCRKIKVNDMHDIANIKTPSRYPSGYKDWASTSTEGSTVVG